MNTKNNLNCVLLFKQDYQEENGPLDLIHPACPLKKFPYSYQRLIFLVRHQGGSGPKLITSLLLQV